MYEPNITDLCILNIFIGKFVLFPRIWAQFEFALQPYLKYFFFPPQVGFFKHPQNNDVAINVFRFVNILTIVNTIVSMHIAINGLVHNILMTFNDFSSWCNFGAKSTMRHLNALSGYNKNICTKRETWTIYSGFNDARICEKRMKTGAQLKLKYKYQYAQTRWFFFYLLLEQTTLVEKLFRLINLTTFITYDWEHFFCVSTVQWNFRTIW